jgi:citrate synthase
MSINLRDAGPLGVGGARPTERWLTATQVARQLGVQRATVYAYVSRGLLGRTLAPDGRTSRFDPNEVEELGRRGRPRRGVRSGTVDVVLSTAITAIDGDRLVLRGHDLADLLGAVPYEAVAELLWTGELGDGRPWSPPTGAEEAVADATAWMPADAPPATRLAAAISALAALDPGRGDLRPATVTAKAGPLLATLPHCLPLLGGSGPVGDDPALSRALWPRLSPLRATKVRLAVLDATLVALADHEMATSTLAARVAASTRANPYACLLAAVGAGSGPLHGRAAVSTQRLLTEAAMGTPASVVVATSLEDRGAVPGFGHPVYTGPDPRAVLVMHRLTGVAPPGTMGIVEAVATAGRAATGLEPNVDFALGAVATAFRMPLGATEAVFLTARTAGWLAHVVEEHGERPLRFRPRSLYTGPLPPAKPRADAPSPTLPD